MRAMRAAMLVTLCLLAGTPLPTPQEPPYRIVLQIDGNEHQLVAGQENTIEIGGQQRKVTATVAATKRFEAAGVQFEFPRDMAFATDDTDALKAWTLDGDDVVVHIHQVVAGDPAAIASTMVATMVEKLKAEAPGPEATEIILGGKPHSAVAVEARVHDGLLTLGILAFGVEAGGKPVVVLIQDSRDEPGKPGAERAKTLELLAKSFALRDAH